MIPCTRTFNKRVRKLVNSVISSPSAFLPQFSRILNTALWEWDIIRTARSKVLILREEPWWLHWSLRRLIEGSKELGYEGGFSISFYAPSRSRNRAPSARTYCALHTRLFIRSVRIIPTDTFSVEELGISGLDQAKAVGRGVAGYGSHPLCRLAQRAGVHG